MNKIKFWIVAIIFSVFLLGVLTILLPNQVTISRTITINTKQEDLSKQLTDFKNWKNWFPLFQHKNIKVDISQNLDTSFANLTNEKGENLSFILSPESKGIINVLVKQNETSNENYQFIVLANDSGYTQLTWNIHMHLGWSPWKRLSVFFVDKIRGPEYDAILNNLKLAAESHQQ
jgi:hypothetical protein